MSKIDDERSFEALRTLRSNRGSGSVPYASPSGVYMVFDPPPSGTSSRRPENPLFEQERDLDARIRALEEFKLRP